VRQRCGRTNERLRKRRERSNESAEQRERRLAAQRNYNHNRASKAPCCEAPCPQPHLGADLLEEVAAPPLKPVGAEDMKRIEEQLQLSIGPHGLDECICAVCDRLVLSKSATSVQCTNREAMDKLRRCLRVPDDLLPPGLVLQYDCTSIHPTLDGMMLSTAGIIAGSGVFDVVICKQCNDDLRLYSSRPPRHAITNGFYVGALPDNLAQPSWIEHLMVQLVTNVTQTRVIRGGCHCAIQSHCLVYEAIPGPPATLLPRRVDKMSKYKIVLAGPVTSAQSEKVRKLHCVRGSVVSGLLEFLLANNHFYEGVSVDESRTESECDESAS
jgi:hypothetical protein